MIDVRHELERLEVRHGGGYYRSRIPCPEDSEIARAIQAFTEASPREQAAFRSGIGQERADLLHVWSERLAALAVRLESGKPIVLGLVGLSLAQGGDEREALLVAPLHRRSAEKLGLDPVRVFDEAAGRTDLAGARWLAELRDSDEQPEDAGYVEDDDGEGFRYERDGGGLGGAPY
jgi:hypothetical protein